MLTSNEAHYELIKYKDIEKLDEKGNVYLTQNVKDGSLWVKKQVSERAADVYRKIEGVYAVNTPYINEVLEYNNEYYIIEEYIRGRSLKDILNDEGTLFPDRVKDIIVQVCSCLNFLHKNKIIHRDITPSNIIISNSDKVYVIDMGISRIKNEESTRDTSILGTAGYAAPEQFGFTQTDATADIYSCGVLMNVMLTGKFPFSEKYGGKIGYIIDRCIEMDRKKRYQSAAELKRAVIKANSLVGNAVYSLGELPGLRGNTLEKVLAIAVYTIASVFASIGLIALIYGEYEVAFIGFYICVLNIMVPFFLAGNYMNYIDIIMHSADKRLKRLMCWFFAFVDFTINILILEIL